MPRPQIIVSAMGSFGHLAFFGQPAKCEVAHTSLRLFPTKIRQPGNQEGTHGTKTTYRRRDCSCNGVDHPNGHGGGHAELVTAFRSSTFAFVLRRVDQLFAANSGCSPGRAGGVASLVRHWLRHASKGCHAPPRPRGIGIFWTRAPMVAWTPPTDAQVIARTILGIANMAINALRCTGDIDA